MPVLQDGPENMNLKDFRQDRHGGIEGLPLQLMIVIVVATMGLAVIIGWMGSIETPHSIGEVTYERELAGGGTTTVIDGTSGTIGDLVITVRDQDGGYLEGAAVILGGMNVKSVTDGTTGPAYAETGPDGRARFPQLAIDPLGTASMGFIEVTVSKAGYGEDSGTRIPVVL